MERRERAARRAWNACGVEASLGEGEVTKAPARPHRGALRAAAFAHGIGFRHSAVHPLTTRVVVANQAMFERKHKALAQARRDVSAFNRGRTSSARRSYGPLWPPLGNVQIRCWAPAAT